MTFNYFRAFYLAKAGTELGLTEVYNRDNWFEDKIINKKNSDGTINFEKIIEDNFLWKDNEYEWAKPYFDMEIKSRFKLITDDIRNTNTCNGNEITLKPEDADNPWEWIMLSLFKDKTSTRNEILNPEKKNLEQLSNYQELEMKWIIWAKDFTFWIFWYKDGDMKDIKVKKTDNLKDFLKDNPLDWDYNLTKYLTIKNSWTETIKFCLYMGWKVIPYSNSLITVRGHYWDMEVGLQSIVKKEVPAWSLDILWWEITS
jgi:hypothetical protein